MRLSALAALASFAASAVAGTAAITPPASADVAADHTYRITTPASLALDVSGASGDNGAPVIQWPLNFGANQSWRVEPSAVPGYQLVRNVNSGKCLAISSPWTAGSGLIQYTCNPPSAFEQWAIDPDQVQGGYLMYSGLQNGLAVDIPGGTINWGTQLIAWPFHHGANQTFVFTRLD